MSLLTNAQLGPAVWLGPFAESSDLVTDILGSLDLLASIEAGWADALGTFQNNFTERLNEITSAQQKVSAARDLIGPDDVFASVSGAQAYNDALAAYAQTRADLATDPQQLAGPIDALEDSVKNAAHAIAAIPDRLGLSISLPSWGQVAATIVAVCAVYFVVRRVL